MNAPPCLLGPHPLERHDMDPRAARARRALEDLEPGDRVAACLADEAELTVLFRACLGAGLSLVPLDPDADGVITTAMTVGTEITVEITAEYDNAGTPVTDTIEVVVMPTTILSYRIEPVGPHSIFVGGEPLPVPSMAPTVGEHTDAVLGEVLGLTEGRIAELRAAGTFGKGVTDT